jgi:predicted O-linked N-acetylglucosamine transferase (SPINDLY family)/SAM-dependent methyltransferase
LSKQSHKNKHSQKPPKPVKRASPDLYDTAVRHYSAGRLEEAGSVAQALLAVRPDNLAALNLAGVIAAETHRMAEAETAYRRALELDPDFSEVHNNLGNLLNIAGRLEEAEAAYRKALELKPDFLDAYNNLGSLLDNAGRPEEAEALYRRALELNPNHPQTLDKLGALLLLYKNRQAEALACFERIVALQPDYPYAFGTIALCRALQCDWSRHAETQRHLRQGVREGKRRAVSLVFLNFRDDPGEQRRSAEIYVQDKFPAQLARSEDLPRYRHPKIRLAYVSPDFYNHPVAHLMADLVERHDRSRFEVIGVSLGPKIRDEWRTRLEKSFDRFLDVQGYSDEAVARQLRELEIDIAVDLAGYTKNAKPGIFARRAAPLQVNYLGYPGTLGAEFIDYLLADRFVIPEADEPCYAEKIVYLPDSFQCSALRRIAERTPTRRELGLPEQGFVFCCFNAAYKFHPPIFDIWMRLLKRIDASVLWLPKANASAEDNLKREAQARGINPDRLIFAPRWPLLAEHLARYRQADLFLDTLPYNAHTTASDALWAGLPVLTCAGTAFAGRVAGSLLRAAGLPELITESLADYEALALHLATHPEELAALKRQLEGNRLSQPLFDVDRFRRHIEAAYTTMWEIRQRGEPPAAFAVEPVEDTVPAAIPTPPRPVSSEVTVENPMQKPPEPARHTDADPYAAAIRQYFAGHLEQARNTVRTLLATQPEHVAALNLSAMIAARTHRPAEAEAAYRRALEFNPDFVEVHNNLGALLKQSGRLAEAEAVYRGALELNPNYADAHHNLGLLLFDKNSRAEALACFERTLAIQPDYPYILNMIALCRAMLCDWSRHAETQERLLRGVREKTRCAQPFTLLSSCDDPREQRRCAEVYVQDKFLIPSARSADLPRYRHPKIRLAYVSPDFHNHPVAYLIADLVERHDRSHFEVIGVSLGPKVHDEWRIRLEKGFDRFLDGHGGSDEAVARQLRELEIDIAVDLAGHTRNSRPGIFARRAAPIQVNYLGYPGTLGAEFIDYLLADRFVVPEADEPCYAEKIVCLPDSFQSSALRQIAERTPTRREFGLPEQGFVFCCFNNTYKIQPPLFDIWMRLLAQVPGSVLWLYQADATVEDNLRREAQARGVAPERLVFGARLPPAEYLARYRRADLFLDTLPYNAGTTASDALWAGLPVVTCAGRSFAGRMGGSLLQAAGLPELITHNLADYEALALHLATQPEKLAALKRQLERHRLNQPLFDVDRFRRHIEAAYMKMWEIWQRGEPPAAFAVEPIENTAPAAIPGHKHSSDLAPGAMPVPHPILTDRKSLKKVLHVGCGPARRERMPKFFHTSDWQEVRLDIDPACRPDIVASMVEMTPVATASVTAIFSSHNLEHLYPHEVPRALEEFHRVLKPDGFALITLPDLQGVAALVAQDRLEDTAYVSPAGPITPLDILYGHRASMARGNLFMAHRTGFTAKTLMNALRKAGFPLVTVQRDGSLNLWAIAFMQEQTPEQLAAMQQALLPLPVRVREHR